MERLGATNGCGQAMWQYDPSLNRFGTTQALMLLPYWSSGCIGSNSCISAAAGARRSPWLIGNR